MEEWREKELAMHVRFRSVFAKYVKDPDAVRFCECLVYLAHLWDDLIDKDKQRTDEEINTGFTLMLGEIPSNPFFQKHIAKLAPMMLSVCINWRHANVLERENLIGHKLTGWQIRQQVLMLFHQCIILANGVNASIELGLEFWKDICGTLELNLSEFLEEMS